MEGAHLKKRGRIQPIPEKMRLEMVIRMQNKNPDRHQKKFVTCLVSFEILKNDLQR